MQVLYLWLVDKLLYYEICDIKGNLIIEIMICLLLYSASNAVVLELVVMSVGDLYFWMLGIMTFVISRELHLNDMNGAQLRPGPVPNNRCLWTTFE